MTDPAVEAPQEAAMGDGVARSSARSSVGGASSICGASRRVCAAFALCVLTTRPRSLATHPVGTDTCSQWTYVHGSHHEFGLYLGCGATCMRAGGTSTRVSMPRSVWRHGDPVTLPLRDRGRGVTTRAQKTSTRSVHCLTRMIGIMGSDRPCSQ